MRFQLARLRIDDLKLFFNAERVLLHNFPLALPRRCYAVSLNAVLTTRQSGATRPITSYRTWRTMLAARTGLYRSKWTDHARGSPGLSTYRKCSTQTMRPRS